MKQINTYQFVHVYVKYLIQYTSAFIHSLMSLINIVYRVFEIPRSYRQIFSMSGIFWYITGRKDQ
jgi:hypothetical protein